MKKISQFLLMAFILSSCNTSFNKSKSYNNIHTDSIVFYNIRNTNKYWLFSEFLLKYPESIYYKNALTSYKKTRDAYYDSLGWPIIDCFRNCASIKIRPNQNILFEHEKINLADLKDSLVTFLINKDDSELKPEKIEIENLNGEIQEVSKGHIELIYVKDSCKNIQQVLIAISESYNIYKNNLSLNWYNKKFEHLDIDRKGQIDSMFLYRLHIFEFEKEYLSPPPPPSSEPDVFKITEE